MNNNEDKSLKTPCEEVKHQKFVPYRGWRKTEDTRTTNFCFEIKTKQFTFELSPQQTVNTYQNRAFHSVCKYICETLIPFERNQTFLNVFGACIAFLS